MPEKDTNHKEALLTVDVTTPPRQDSPPSPDFRDSISGRALLRNSICSPRRRRTPLRNSVERFSISDEIKTEKSDKPITLTDIVLSDLDIINDCQADNKEKEESHNRLNLIFSNQKDILCCESVKSKLTKECFALRMELYLFGLIKNITQNILNQKKLWRESQWHEYLISVVNEIISVHKDNSQASGEGNCADKICHALPSQKKDPDLCSFFKKKNEALNLYTLFSNKSNKELREFVKSIKTIRIAAKTRVHRIKFKFLRALGKKMQEFEEQTKSFEELTETSDGYGKNPPKINNKIIYETLNNVADKEIEKYQEFLRSAKVKLISDKDTEDLLTKGLQSYLVSSIKIGGLLKALSYKTSKDLGKVKESYMATKMNEDDFSLFTAEEYVLMYLNEMIELNHENPSYLVDSSSYNKRDNARRLKLELESYMQDNSHLIELEKLSNMSIQDLSLYYRSLEDEKLEIEAQKIEVEKQILTIDQRKKEVNCAFESHRFLQETQETQVTQVTPLSIMSIFNQPLDMLTVWPVLRKMQLHHERFEKLAHFYKEAIIHVTEKLKNCPDSELYTTKRNVLLNTLYHYAKTAHPLEEAVVYIANALIASNSTLALRQPACIPDPHVLNKTQRLILKARNSLPKEGSCPSLQLSSVHAAPAENQIQEMLKKLQGTDKEQEERQKESVCNALMKEKQSWLQSFWSSFWSGSTESSVNMYDHPIHRSGSCEV